MHNGQLVSHFNFLKNVGLTKITNAAEENQNSDDCDTQKGRYDHHPKITITIHVK